MPGRYDGQVVLVTGGASGIGAAIVRRAAAEGAKVVAGDLNEEGLARIGADLGNHFASMPCDVSDEQSLVDLVALAVRRFGRLDAAFNVAGAAKVGAIVDMSREDWQATIDVCLNGVFFSMKHEARQLLAQGEGGAIINVASMNSLMPMFDTAAYSAAKAGVAMLSRSGALEWGESGIRVNTISPGFTDTPMSAPLKALPAAKAKMLERIPGGRMAQPEEMAAVALFLASRDASYVSGVNIAVDAAWSTTGGPDLRALYSEAGLSP